MPLDERDEVAAAVTADEQIALPVPRDVTVEHLGGSLRDADQVRDARGAGGDADALLWAPADPPGA